jgi:hypothetical protein
MLKNSQQIPAKSKSSGNVHKNNVEELILYLCQKIASINSLNEKVREEFTNNSYAYMVKLFCSDSFTPIYDSFEVSQKIKKKLALKGRHVDASSFSELETKFSKQKLIKNQASVLQFFLTYFTEQNKYESLSNKNVSIFKVFKIYISMGQWIPGNFVYQPYLRI